MPKKVVLFLGQYDWANICNEWTRAINKHSRKYTARACTVFPHPYTGYVEDLVLTGISAQEQQKRFRELSELIRQAEVIITSGDGTEAQTFKRLFGGLGLLDRLPNGERQAKVVAYHAGSAYRNNHEYQQANDRALGAVQRWVGCDSLRLHSDDIPTFPILPTLDATIDDGAVSRQIAELQGGRKLRLLHIPSNRETKGSHLVERVFRALEQDEQVDCHLLEKATVGVSREAKKASDVYIDQLNPEIGGFGVSAIEALVGGNVVLADFRNCCSKRVGEILRIPPLVMCKTPNELLREIQALRDSIELVELYLAQAKNWWYEVGCPAKCSERLESNLDAVMSIPTN